ncbi:MAG: hypothetical protein P4M15_12615 [Alphaproteobacteria bacterium]|nr:hypothetical protein [Alphaproteobacteria bacterium]
MPAKCPITCRQTAIGLFVALVLLGIGAKAYCAYMRHVRHDSLTAYVLKASDLAHPHVVPFDDGHDYYVTTKPNAAGCTTASAQRVLGQAAGGTITAVTDEPSVTATYCNTPPATPAP